MNNQTVKKINKFFAIVLTIVLIAAVVYYCFEMQVQAADKSPRPSFPPHHQLPQPMPLALQLLLDTMNVNVIAQLTGEPLNDIKQKLAQDPVYTMILLEEKGISFEAYRQAMDEQSFKLIEQAVSANIISQKQADEILQEMKTRIAQLESRRLEEEIMRLMDDEHGFDE